jgi:hypothetical protein
MLPTTDGRVRKGPGRPKGSPNKTTAAAKEVIARAANELGGIDWLVAWAKEDPQNERAFWTSMYTKLLPLRVGGDPDGAPIKIVWEGMPMPKPLE